MAEKPPVEGMVRIWGWHCQRCDHEWTPRNRDHAPKVCPNPTCKSPYWQTPRRIADPPGGVVAKKAAKK